MYFSTTYPSPIGLMTLASDGDALIGLWLEGQKYHGGNITSQMTINDDLALFVPVKAWLDRYFSGEKPPISDLPLAPIGTAFRQAVWQILCDIPYGETSTYGKIAEKLAQQMGVETMSSQAIGGAVGHNPISIIIPCHRVVGSNGSLTGYAGGIDVKTRLLDLEGVNISALSIPKRGTAL